MLDADRNSHQPYTGTGPHTCMLKKHRWSGKWAFVERIVQLSQQPPALLQDICILALALKPQQPLSPELLAGLTRELSAHVEQFTRGSDLLAHAQPGQLYIGLMNEDSTQGMYVATRMIVEWQKNGFLHRRGQLFGGISSLSESQFSGHLAMENADSALGEALLTPHMPVRIHESELVILVPSTTHSYLHQYRELSRFILQDRKIIGLLDQLTQNYVHFHPEHQARVANLAVGLARTLGISGQELSDIMIAAFVRDLGMIRFPPAVVNTSRSLDSPIQSLIQTHPKLSTLLLERFDINARAMQTVLQHHERYDGQGYPNRLSGSQISRGAQIVAFADAAVAMNSVRPYRPAFSRDQTFLRLASEAGHQFEPEFVRKLVDNPILSECLTE